jgi:hypothetical protein
MKPVLDLEILIATKDRSSNLEKLLASINDSSSLPKRVIIVYSGEEIDKVVNKFKNCFTIESIYSEVASQVKQKQLGINALDHNCNWVLFLDDDLLIKSFTLENLFKNYLQNERYKDYAGFGLALDQIKKRKISLFVKFVLAAFKLYSFKSGSITISGHPQTYLDQLVNCRVAWLNGLSVWRRDTLQFYNSNSIYIPYSAYEDVIFSYQVGKFYKLLFLADIIVENQSKLTSSKLKKAHFMYGAFLRYYFVDSNPEFSKFWLLVSQVVRSIDFIFFGDHETTPFDRIISATKLWSVLFLAYITKVDGKSLIKSKLELDF